MTLFDEIRDRNKTTIDAAKELGRGLMRGNSEELKLGYSWENAAHVCSDAYDLPKIDAHEVKIYLFGFANGMQDVEVTDETIAKFGAVSEHMGEALRAGWHTGQDEPSTIYPATITSPTEES